jgi:protein phosphatase PTC7
MLEEAHASHPTSQPYEPNPISTLHEAYERTLEATSPPNDWQGTTTAAGAQLHYQAVENDSGTNTQPLLYVTNLGDSQVMVVRPSQREMVYKTKEQWHWFDCPRQLGTNSPDTPRQNAVMDKVDIKVGDVVLAMSDGVIDNLWEHEIVENVSDSIRRWESVGVRGIASRSSGDSNPGMTFVAEELMLAAKRIALDPFAESPFMEHAIEEGLASEGGKESATFMPLYDISLIQGNQANLTISALSQHYVSKTIDEIPAY